MASWLQLYPPPYSWHFHSEIHIRSGYVPVLKLVMLFHVPGQTPQHNTEGPSQVWPYHSPTSSPGSPQLIHPEPTTLFAPYSLHLFSFCLENSYSPSRSNSNIFKAFLDFSWQSKLCYVPLLHLLHFCCVFVFLLGSPAWMFPFTLKYCDFSVRTDCISPIFLSPSTYHHSWSLEDGKTSVRNFELFFYISWGAILTVTH